MTTASDTWSSLVIWARSATGNRLTAAILVSFKVLISSAHARVVAQKYRLKSVFPAFPVFDPENLLSILHQIVLLKGTDQSIAHQYCCDLAPFSVQVNMALAEKVVQEQFTNVTPTIQYRCNTTVLAAAHYH